MSFEQARRLLTCRQAAVAVLGWADTRASGQKMLRVVKRRERQTGVNILVKDGGATSPFLITEARLRDHFPELFSKRNEVARLLKQQLEDVNDKLAELKLRDNALAASIRDLRSDVRKLESAIPQPACGASPRST